MSMGGSTWATALHAAQLQPRASAGPNEGGLVYFCSFPGQQRAVMHVESYSATQG